MKRLRPPREKLFHATWPEPARDHSGSLFSPRPPLRRLVVAVDASILDEAERAPHDTRLSLLGHEYVRCYRYADEGPPASARTSTDARGGRIPPGWIDVGPLRQGVRPVAIASEDTVIHAGVPGNATDIAGEDEESGAYPQLDFDGRAAARTADAVAIQAACEAEADIFVTGRTTCASS